MKTIANTLYLIFGCAAMLSACRQEEAPSISPDGDDRRIVFRTSLPGLETKAAGIVTDLTYFRLTAFDESDKTYVDEAGTLTEYFKNQRLEKKSADSEKFVSDNCVWPKPGQEDDLLHFFAYYPERPDSELVNGSKVDGSEATLGYKIVGFSVAEDIGDQVDFVTAYATGTMEEKLFAGIDLNFRHQLSRVEVKAKGAHKSCTIEVAGVSFGNALMQGDFEFQTSEETDGVWSETSKGDTEYIFREGDAIVTVGADPVSIMGAKINAGSADNCAMLIPASLTAWAYDTDAENAQKGLYLNVLLRVIDATPTAGKGEQRYPYNDCNQGLNSFNIPRVVLAVDNAGKITGQPVTLYKDAAGNYFTDAEKRIPYTYTVPSGSTIKEFGWAALPISGEWEPGKIYTYTLDYTNGVGVHGPETPSPDDVAPKAGDPIISDRVGVSLGFKDWTNGGTVGVTVPGN